MSKLQDIINLDKKYYMNTFGDRVPVCFEYGKGVKLWDTEGKEYYDFLGGIAVNALGHSHPNLVNAIKEQAEKLIHCSSYYYIETQAQLAELLVKNSCMDKVFFANSGAEANEGAIKLSRIYFKRKNQPDKIEIITLEQSFHGRTLATIAATGQNKHQKSYCPLTPSFISVPINNLEYMANAINGTTCAVMVEPIQGESGVNLNNLEYMQGLRKLCDERNVLLIFDEVQCGLGRTGKLFAYEHFGIEPDIMTLAKALGGGFPIGALCAKEFVASAFSPGDHGSTFGGNPLACAAGLAATNTIINDGLVENSAETGQYFMSKLNCLKDKHSLIKEVRGKGLMIGVEIIEPLAKTIKQMCFNKGFLIGSVEDNILRFLPPLITEPIDIDKLIETLKEIFSQLEETHHERLS